MRSDPEGYKMGRATARLAWVVAISLLATGVTFAQPAIPKDRIPEGCDEEVARQISRLYSADPLERLKALQELAKMDRSRHWQKATPAIPFLASMLGDKTVVRVPDQTVIGHHDYSIAEEAARVLERLGRRAGRPAMEELIPLLKASPDPDVRALAAQTMDRILPWFSTPERRAQVPASLLEAWLVAIRDDDHRVRPCAAQGLGRIGDPRAMEPLIAALKDEHISVRRHAAEALGKLRAEQAVAPLIELLAEKNREVELAAQEALGVIGAPAVEPLIAIIADPDSPVRESACYAFHRIRDQRATELFLAAMKHKSAKVRSLTAPLLAGVAGAEAIGPLLEALTDEDDEVRGSAASALSSIREAKGRAVEPLLRLLQTDKSPRVRQCAAGTLGRLAWDQPRVIDALLAAMKDESALVRGGAVAGLSGCRKGSEKVIRAFLSALSDPADHVRREAVRFLGKLREKRAVDPLIRMLRDDEDNLVRGQAAEALGNIGDKRAVEPLLEAMGRETEYFRRKDIKKALVRLTGHDLGLDLNKWRDWWREQKRE